MKELKEFAKKLTNSKFNEKSYRNIPKELIEEAKEKDIVIVYGSSDDLMELDGAIYDEFGCYDGGTCFLDKDGVFERCRCDCKYSQQALKKCKNIICIWDNEEWTWTYKTDIPHENFEMYDDDEKYCLGIVFYKKFLEE